ncbi:MAG: response regulator [Sulfurimonas sp.]|nr:response regulator [Sulfurimonas sp.]
MTKILIVDDNDNNRLTLELLLENFENIETSEATNGKEAVEMCEKEKYDLVFMDLMMPVMNGIEATIIIKDISKSSMIIALSALDDKESKQRMLLAGAEDYLTKPIDSEMFNQRVKNYINIIELRKEKRLNNDAINPFTKSVYDRKIIFYVKNENSIVQFWDFFLQSNQFACEDFSDYIRIIYGISRWLIKTGKQFTIDVEHSDDNIYIMVNKTDSIKKGTIHNIVTHHIPNAVFMVNDGTLSFKLKKIKEVEKEVTKIDDETKSILSKTHLDNPTAQQYVAQTAISIMPKIESLEKIEDSLGELIISFEREPSKESMEIVCVQLDAYCSVIELLTEFDHLVFAVKTLLEFLRNLENEQLKSDKIKNFVSQLLNLLSDLASWREMVFVKQEAIDIHYLDASLLSSCLQLEAIFEENTEVDEGDDLEFF